MIYDAIIIGGGAAGLFCAIEAGKRGRRVLVVEHNAEVGRKIIISGGGRCNFTNIHTSAENFVSRNPHFCKSALSRYPPGKFVDLVRKHNIPFYEKTLGQLFCRDSSRRIIEMLLGECRDAGVEIMTGCPVKSVSRSVEYVLETGRGTFRAKKLVVACGGLSFPKIGASDLGYRLARQFKLEIVETRPSLVAMVLDGANYKQVAGVSLNAVVTTHDQSFRENILFTHRGLSGPAMLQVSNYWTRDESVLIDLLPDLDVQALLTENRSSRRDLGNFLGGVLPQRFAQELADREFANKPLYQMEAREIDRLRHMLHEWKLRFRDTEGYDRAEVTLGGVSTEDLSSRTMEATTVRGLYFIGEVVDVTGWLGGYNFQWAWASGFAAGADL